MKSPELYSRSALFVLHHPDALFENTPDDLLHYWLEIDRASKCTNGWDNPLFHIFILIEAFSRPSRRATYRPLWVRKRFEDFRFFIEQEVLAREEGRHIPQFVPLTDLHEYCVYRVFVERDVRRRLSAK